MDKFKPGDIVRKISGPLAPYEAIVVRCGSWGDIRYYVDIWNKRDNSTGGDTEECYVKIGELSELELLIMGPTYGIRTNET